MKKIAIMMLSLAFLTAGVCAQKTTTTTKKAVKTEQCADCKAAGKDKKECAKNHKNGTCCKDKKNNATKKDCKKNCKKDCKKTCKDAKKNGCTKQVKK